MPVNDQDAYFVFNLPYYGSLTLAGAYAVALRTLGGRVESGETFEFAKVRQVLLFRSPSLARVEEVSKRLPAALTAANLAFTHLSNEYPLPWLSKMLERLYAVYGLAWLDHQNGKAIETLLTMCPPETLTSLVRTAYESFGARGLLK